MHTMLKTGVTDKEVFDGTAGGHVVDVGRDVRPCECDADASRRAVAAEGNLERAVRVASRVRSAHGRFLFRAQHAGLHGLAHSRQSLRSTRLEPTRSAGVRGRW